MGAAGVPPLTTISGTSWSPRPTGYSSCGQGPQSRGWHRRPATGMNPSRDRRPRKPPSRDFCHSSRWYHPYKVLLAFFNSASQRKDHQRHLREIYLRFPETKFNYTEEGPQHSRTRPLLLKETTLPRPRSDAQGVPAGADGGVGPAAAIGSATGAETFLNAKKQQTSFLNFFRKSRTFAGLAAS